MKPFPTQSKQRQKSSAPVETCWELGLLSKHRLCTCTETMAALFTFHVMKLNHEDTSRSNIVEKEQQIIIEQFSY